MGQQLLIISPKPVAILQLLRLFLVDFAWRWHTWLVNSAVYWKLPLALWDWLEDLSLDCSAWHSLFRSSIPWFVTFTWFTGVIHAFLTPNDDKEKNIFFSLKQSCASDDALTVEAMRKLFKYRNPITICSCCLTC